MLSSNNEIRSDVFKSSTFSKANKSSPDGLLLFMQLIVMSFYKTNRKEQKRFYSSQKWIKLRDAYLKQHPLCERCLAAGVSSVAEHVHHKIELTEDNYKDPNISLSESNLEALCFECHRKEHHDLSEVGADYYFDSDGNLKKKST